jgi:hypothetical protein
MFARIKNYMLERNIRACRRYSVVDKQFHSFATARTVGVLFKFEKNFVPKEVQELLSFLKRNRQFHYALGYHEGRENPDNFLSTNRVAVFNKSCMNWYNRPTADSVEAFLHQNYDIVIDLCRENVAPLQYIAKCASAATLIGGHYYDGCPYDLIVDAQKTCDLSGYIEQVKYYLAIMTQAQNNDIQ